MTKVPMIVSAFNIIKGHLGGKPARLPYGNSQSKYNSHLAGLHVFYRCLHGPARCLHGACTVPARGLHGPRAGLHGACTGRRHLAGL